MAEGEAPDLLPASLLNALVYCPRLFFLEHVQGEWEDSADTLAGRRAHRRVDARSDPLPDPAQLAEMEDAPRPARSVTASLPDDGLIARADLVECDGGTVCPIEYKRGAVPDLDRIPDGLWPADRVALGV